MELKVERSCYRSSSVASRPGIWFSLVESSLREPLLLNFLPSGMGFTIITGQAQCCAQYSLTLPRKTLHMRGKKESTLGSQFLKLLPISHQSKLLPSETLSTNTRIKDGRVYLCMRLRPRLPTMRTSAHTHRTSLQISCLSSPTTTLPLHFIWTHPHPTIFHMTRSHQIPLSKITKTSLLQNSQYCRFF
jgi:hypothetical protein